MKLIMTGSGGCVSTPRPCCDCRVCTEAREKGFPYARTGCSLYLEDGKVLIDTPEDINISLNHVGIKQIDHILYSHIDPDHTMGMRLIEQLRMDWLNVSVGKTNQNPVTVGTMPEILEDLKIQGTKYGSALQYYEHRGLVRLQPMTQFEAGGVQIELIPVDETRSVAIFVLSQNGRKVIYAPCDVKPFPDYALFYDADLLIIGNTIVGEVLKDGFVLEQNNPLRRELFVMEEIVALREKYRIPSVIITHLEEDWGKSFEDYLALEQQYSGIRFGYDGMEVSL